MHLSISFFFSLHPLAAGLLAAGLLCMECSHARGQLEDKALVQLVSLIDSQAVYLNGQWLALLHYRQQKSGAWESEADNPAFFISARGKTSPRQELIALITALSKDSAAYCRFPARSRWAIHRLNIQNVVIPDCIELRNWKARFDMGQASILFASAYVGNPASMFGHTFLRFSARNDGDKSGALLSMTVNYAADSTGGDGYLNYIARGLTGGFDGIVETEAMFMHLRRYVENEGRDLWEYRLKLAPEEIELLIMHVWELRKSSFDYYYLDENCSYRLLAILAVVKPELFEYRNFRRMTVPIDTIRHLAARGAIDKVDHWPSAMKQFEAHARELPPAAQDLAYRIARGLTGTGDTTLDSLGTAEKAAVLSLAMEYLGLLIQHGIADPVSADRRVHDIIKARAETGVGFVFAPYEGSEVDPRLGHRTRRIAFAGGRSQDKKFFELGFRLAGHDLLDPLDGHMKGTQTEFLNVGYRLEEDSGGRLERLQLFRVASYTPVTKFFHSRSMDFNIARERKPLNGESLLFSTVNGSMGYSVSACGQLVSALAKLGLDYNGELENEFDFTAGAVISALGQFPGFSYQAGFEYEDYMREDMESRRTGFVNGSFPLNVNNALRLTAKRSRQDKFEIDDVSLGYFFYF